MASRVRRLNIDEETRHIYLKIKKQHSNTKLTNSKLFSLALTIGYQHEMKEKLTKKSAFIKYETIDSDLFSAMLLLAINEFGIDNEEWIQNPLMILDLAEEYANAGIKILENLIEDINFDLEFYLLSNIFDAYDESMIQANLKKFV